jgi:hypothetical protein
VAYNSNVGELSLPSSLPSGVKGVDQLYLTKFGGVVRSAWMEQRYMMGHFVEETLTEAKETQEEFTGLTQITEWRRNYNALNLLSGGGGDTLMKSVPFGRWKVRLDRYPWAFNTHVHWWDLKQSADGGFQKSAKIGQGYGMQMGKAEDLCMLLTLVQTACLPDPGYGGGFPTKAQAGSYANFPNIAADGSGTSLSASYPSRSIYTNSDLTTSASAIEDLILAANLFATRLNWTRGKWCMQIRPSWLKVLLKGQGMNVPIGGTIDNKVSQLLNRQLGAKRGSLQDFELDGACGFKIISNPYLYALGTEAESFFGVPTANASDPGNREKYLPNAGNWAQTIAGIQGFDAPTNDILNLGLANDSNPRDWDTTTNKKVKSFLNNIGAIFYVEQETCKTNILDGLDFLVKDVEEMKARWHSASVQKGHGPIRSEGVLLAVSALN